MIKLKISYILLLIVALSCTHKASKENKNDIIIPQTVNYVLYKDSNLLFQIADQAIVKPVDSKGEGSWFNIEYPNCNATIYCSFLPITQESLRKALEDSYQLAFNHIVQSDGINQNSYSNDIHKTYGIIYDIEGHVAVPIQFFVTDSISNFFRGSLYYNSKVDPDSAKTTTEYLRKDILKIMETLEWKN